MLLKLERGKRAAGEIVVDAAIAHRRPVAHCARGQRLLAAGKRKQLLQSLHSIKNSRAGAGHDHRLVRLNGQYIAFVFHRRIEYKAVPGQHGFGFGSAGAQQNHTIDGLRGCGLGRRILFQCLFQVARGKLIVRVTARHADRNGCRQSRIRAKVRLAGRRQQVNLGKAMDGEGQQERNGSQHRSTHNR